MLLQKKNLIKYIYELLLTTIAEYIHLGIGKDMRNLLHTKSILIS